MSIDWREYQMNKQSNSLLAKYGWHAVVCFLFAHPAWGTVNFTSSVHSDCPVGDAWLHWLASMRFEIRESEWKRAISPAESIPWESQGSRGLSIPKGIG